VLSQRSSRRNFYTNQISNLEEKLNAVESDLKSAIREEERLSLTNRAEALLEEIDKLYFKLDELNSESPDLNVRDRGLEKVLQKINFVRAKETASLLKTKLATDGGSVLFFIQKSKKQMGHYCIEEVINIIMSDQMIDGEVLGSYRRIPIDLGSAISQYNEVEFLTNLASYFNIEALADLDALSERLREKIRSSIDLGTTIFLEIKSLDDLLEKQEFLCWFVERFWQPLIDDVMVVSKKYKSKFIVALIADSQILTDPYPDHFCDEDSFDCYKMLELPLPNWTIEDIHSWLLRFHTLSSCMKEKTDADLQRVARKIHRDSEGTPESVCVSLRKEFV